MIGISLSPGLLTDSPNQPAEKQLLDDYGGSQAMLRALADMGVGSVELRSLRPDTPLDLSRRCARAVVQAGMHVTIHATLKDMSASAFFAYLMPALNELPQDHPTVPLTVHTRRTGSETLDQAATISLLADWGDEAARRELNVLLALENNRIHGPGLSIVECDGVGSTLRQVNRPNVGACFDFGHLYSNFLTYPGCTPFLPPDDFLHRAVHTHIHGVTGITHWPVTNDNLPLEDYLIQLKQAGYRGIFNLELECGRYWRDINPREGFEMSYYRLANTLTRLGMG